MIAVIGGDDRSSGRYDWPKNLDLRYYTGFEAGRLEAAIRGGKIEHVVFVTKFLDHSTEKRIRALNVECTRWPGSFNELIKRLPEMFPQAQVSPPPAEEPDLVEEEDMAKLVSVPEPEPKRPIEDIVAERTHAYAAALVASKKASKYLAELREELDRAEKARDEAVLGVSIAHKALLDATESI